MTEKRKAGNLVGKSIVSFEDMTLDDVHAVFETADDINANMQAYFGKATGKIAATLFYEPSTRTRLSFEAAMQRLGGSVISTWDVSASSVAKGESLADTVRVVGGYSDLLVIRHPWEGAAKMAAEYAPVPVINAGDGGHEHPTQTLCDLYTLREHHGNLEGLEVALCGDLQNGRTVHSLAFALARLKANIRFVPGEGKDIPDYVLRRLERDYGAVIQRESIGILGALFWHAPTNREGSGVDAIYVTPSEPNQLAMSSIEGTTVKLSVGNDELSIYVTRRQTERGGEPGDQWKYPRLTAQALRASTKFNNISILHPLPRVDELSPEVDEDPRSLYFRQAAIGIPIRMALLWHILDLGGETTVVRKQPHVQEVSGLLYSHPGLDCSNGTCVSNQERQFARSQFEVVRNGDYKLRCLYCDQENNCTYAGNTKSWFYYPSQLLDRFLPPVRPEHVRFFRSSEEAESAGFRRASYKWDSYQPMRNDSGKHWLDMISGRVQ